MKDRMLDYVQEVQELKDQSKDGYTVDRSECLRIEWEVMKVIERKSDCKGGMLGLR